MMEKFLQVADKVGKKIGIDLRYFIKGGFWLSVEQFITNSKGIILVILFTTFLTKDDYGAYNYAFSILGIMTMTSMPGMRTAIIQAMANKKDKTYFVCQKLVLKSSILGSLALVAVAIYFFVTGSSSLATALVVVAPIYPFYEASKNVIPFLNGQKKFRQVTVVRTILSIAALSVLPIVLFISKNPHTLFISLVFVETIILGYFAFFKSKKIARNNEVDPSSKSFGKKLTLVSIVEIISSHIDKLVIGSFFGTAQLAIYSIALIAPDFMKQLITPLTATFLPKLVEVKITAKNKSKLRSQFLKMFIPVTLMVLVFLVVTPTLYKFVFPKYAAESTKLALVYGLSFIAIPAILFRSYFGAAKKFKELSAMKLTYSFSIVILTPIFIYFWGLWGAIFAKISARVLNLLVSVIAYETSFKNEELPHLRN